MNEHVVLRVEDMCGRIPEGEVRRGQGKEAVVHRKDTCGKINTVFRRNSETRWLAPNTVMRGDFYFLKLEFRLSLSL